MKKSLVIFFLLVILLINFINLVYADNEMIKNSLAKLGIINTEIQSTPVAGIKAILTNNGILYLTEDGKYLIHGIIYSISGKQPINITNKILMRNLEALEKEMIIYKAPREKYIITVFTDITCNFCHKLHKKIKDYNELGITVRYLAFPRIGSYNNSQSEKDMRAIWCAKDRKKAFEEKINGKNIHSVSCNIDIKNHYNMGIQFGVVSTPTIVLDNGYVALGYHRPQEMKALLEANTIRKE